MNDILQYFKSEENIYESVHLRLLQYLLEARVRRRMARVVSEYAVSEVCAPDPLGKKSELVRAGALMLVSKYGEKDDVKLAAASIAKRGILNGFQARCVLASYLRIGINSRELRRVERGLRMCCSDRDVISFLESIEECRSMSGPSLPKLWTERLRVRRLEMPTVEFMEAEKKFRRVKGYRDMPQLLAALDATVGVEALDKKVSVA